MEIKKVNIYQKLTAFKEYWSPKIIGELNNQLVKVAKFKGEFMMHHHELEDELFFVLKGEMFMELENNTLRLREGEMIIIPKGTPHKPYAPEDVHVMLFEPATTLNTGNVTNEKTVSKLNKI